MTEADQCVRISVHNWGNPMGENELVSIFEPYQRLRPAHGDGPQGWGLGLSLVHGLVDAHGGTIRAQSSAEAGTTFTVELPRKAAS